VLVLNNFFNSVGLRRMFINKNFLVIGMYSVPRCNICACIQVSDRLSKKIKLMRHDKRELFIFSTVNSIWNCTTSHVHFDALLPFMFFWSMDKLLRILFNKNSWRSNCFYLTRTYKQFQSHTFPKWAPLLLESISTISFFTSFQRNFLSMLIKVKIFFTPIESKDSVAKSSSTV